MEQFHHIWQKCIPVAASTSRRFLRSTSRGDLMVPWQCNLERSAMHCDSTTTCIVDCTQSGTVHSQSQCTVRYSAWDMIRRSRDCLGCKMAPYTKCPYLLIQTDRQTDSNILFMPTPTDSFRYRIPFNLVHLVDYIASFDHTLNIHILIVC